MSEKITLRVGEALVAGGPPGTAAEPEVVIGEMDGPFGTAFANLMGNQTKGHSKVLAIMNTDIMVRPPTLMVSKVTVNDNRYTNILMGTVQGAIANGVLDAVSNGDIPKEKANDLKSNDPFIIDSLGWALFKLKRFQESKDYLQLAVKLMPADPIVNDHYGDVLWLSLIHISEPTRPY